METDRQPTFWDQIDPLWMFRARPEDFRSFGTSICPGLFWLPGMTGLLALHIATVLGVWYVWAVGDGWLVAILLPVTALWGWFVPADLKFRRQRPTRQERAGFDNTVINWFGFVTTMAFYIALIPALVIALVWWLA